jgi:hypothetical protein
VNGPGRFQDAHGQAWIGSFFEGAASALSAEL